MIPSATRNFGGGAGDQIVFIGASDYANRAVTANPSDETAAQALAQLRERVATRFKAAAEGGAQPAARAGAAARTLPRASRER